MKKTLFLIPVSAVIMTVTLVTVPDVAVARTITDDTFLAKLNRYTTQLLSLQSQLQSFATAKIDDEPTVEINKEESTVVPFYSQFYDITSPQWQKVGCGIASIAMLIDYYSDETVVVDNLLQTGINRGAYLSDAGWTHAGLIGLARDYGLSGESRSLASLSLNDAFAALTDVVEEGPVMVSVHYTFEPTNPIPHLVVVHGIEDGKVHYSDPAEATGNGTISAEKFKRAWKQRYIVVRPDAQLALGN